ncbi:hypothetical protein [Streptomyces sp. N35]|uniref:hypothetical protein n=1 Tax=Streptomyces sp. N35 TaxID=2795730 RepID=UPI0018F4B1C8|nr:hypothetical protein [Streptomyces sp. N35]
MAIELPDDLIAKERAAWAAIQAGTLNVETAAQVQAGITALAEATGESRYTIEQALKHAVRHPEPEADAA